MIDRALQREGEAARSIVESMREILADDDELKADTIEGETNLREAISAALHRLTEIDAHHDGIKSAMEQFKRRANRLDAQAERLRAAITTAMEMAELKKIELPIATVSLRAVPPKVVITSEADIPSAYFKDPAPVLDRKAIMDAIKAQQPVPGAELSNGGMSITVRLA